MIPAVLLAATAALGPADAADPAWVEIPIGRWQGMLDADVPALKRRAAAAVALPVKEAAALTAATAEPLPPGLYELRATLRPSHVANAIAFHSGVRILADGGEAGFFPGQFFARDHRPEARVIQLVKRKGGPLAIGIEAFSDPAVAEQAWVAVQLAKGGPTLAGSLDDGKDLPGIDLDLETVLDPGKAVYFVVDKLEFRPRSRSGRVVRVEMDKIRYCPAETLTGHAVLEDVGGQGGRGSLNLFLEHHLGKRIPVKSLPVELRPGAVPSTVNFDMRLPEAELGYALVAEYVSADGVDRSEAAEYFTIAKNFQRVAIFSGGLATRDAVQDDDTIRRGLAEARAGYSNASEYFAWAEDDLVEMSPATDFWSSGQTNYRMHKQTLQRQIELAHEQGFGVSTYGKYLMSGFPGWETAYDYPLDHRGQYDFPIGMYLGVSTTTLDRRRNRDVRCYSRNPEVSGNAFKAWWNVFLPINCDATPHMVRLAAEECVRSIDMFGWDAIRWDDHPRGGGQVGRSGDYDQAAARRTQSLVRYFKDIVAQRHPDFRHGYNYLLIEGAKGHDWAKEDFELDELCRGGGLLMNESIGNASGGYTFAQIARNLQVDGDLCRERGGYYLGISYASSPRDRLIESALWAAGGCRPYGAMTREVCRYCTRYACYTFDENLRRLAQPEKVLAPAAETRLWWQPFVYETPAADGRRELVVNLLNLPQEETRPPRDFTGPPVWNMPSGTDPVDFEITLPPGLEAVNATMIDPWTLAVEPVPLAGNRVSVPPVAIWTVLVIELAADSQAPALAGLCGAPATFGATRPDLDPASRRPEVVLSPDEKMPAVEERFAALQPNRVRQRREAEAALDALRGKELEQALLARREPPEALVQQWWKGGSLPADLAIKDKRPDFGDLAPRRDGRVDIHYGRGTMDYRLAAHAAFARLDRFRVHESGLWGGGVGYHLGGRVDWPDFPRFDLMVFTGIPHSAIGVENSYALVEYVKAGGGVLFTGGEYAFGKGGYMHTVLERELLPLRCAGMQDTAHAWPPLPFEPGPDFGELGVTVDFSARPVYWVRNRAVLEPGTKVFLKSGDRPILVGRSLGKGRVACLLVDHRGKSEAGTTAFWDWPDWPKLAAAVLDWLAPDALRTDPVRPPGDMARLLREFESAGEDEILDSLVAGDDPGPSALPGGLLAAPEKQLAGEQLQARIKLVWRALEAGDSPELAAALARQIATVGSLPLDVRLRIVRMLQRLRPPVAAEQGRTAIKTAHSVLHGSGGLLLAVAGDPGFRTLLDSQPALAVDSEMAARERARDLALAVVVYPKPDLVEEGRKRVAAWDRQQADCRAAFVRTAGHGDTELIESSGPYLDAEAIFARLAWLAYLVRHEPAAYSQAFIREWLWIGEYEDYCERSIQDIAEDKRISNPVRRSLQMESWSGLRSRLSCLRELARPEAERMLAERPAEVAAVMAGLRFGAQIRDAINLLGQRAAQESGPVLAPLLKAYHPDLATFAAERLGSGGNRPGNGR